MVTVETVERSLSALARGLHAPQEYPVFPSREILPQAPYSEKVRALVYPVLFDLVKPDCIYASTDRGNEGMYHARFGRDGVTVQALILDGVIAAGRRFGFVESLDQGLLNNAINGMLSFGRYQAQEDVEERGERKGCLPHEVRTENHFHLTAPKDGNAKPWYFNGREMKNYDSVDVTPLWAFQFGKLVNLGLIEPTPEEFIQFRKALEWILQNIVENDGFVGFTFDPNRKYGGPRNQNWMDSEFTMRHQDGSPQVYPMKPVEVQPISWAALKNAEPVLRNFGDLSFSAETRKGASYLKDKFNGEDGFIFEDSKGLYLAEAVDGDGRQVRNITCNPGFLLWASYGRETIIKDKEVEPDVIRRLVSSELYDPGAGLRTYSQDTKVFFDPYAYHNGPNTFWPFISGIVASGLDELGYARQAEQLSLSSISAVEKLGSCIEIFQKDGPYLRKFKDPETGQTSCTDQTWTAAALYYGYHRFLRL